MKTCLLTLLGLSLIPCLALAQTNNVQQTSATRRVLTDIVVPSGKSVTVESGGSITIAAGATTSGILSNASLAGLNSGIATITSGTGEIATFNTSAGLASAIGDETGSGSLAFSNSPVFVTPTLGVATATSLNKLAFTAPATSATLTIADGKTLTASNTLTFTGTDSTSFAFPSTSGTVVTLAATQTLTGKTLTAPVLTTPSLGVASGTSLTLAEGSAPSTPASANVILYAKSDGLLYSKDDAGAETLVSGGSGGGGGSIGGSSGSTDNAIVRADGTGGSTVQSSLLTIDDAGAVTVPEIAAPSTPASGKVVVYAKADGLLYSKDDAGAETALGVSGAGTGDVVGPAAATDEALARFDSTTGKLLQDGTITASDAGAMTFPEIAAPSTPGSTKVVLYAKSDGLLYSKDDAGTETVVTGGSGGGGGTALFVGRSAKTSAYTVVAGDEGYLIDCTSGTFSVSLTASATLGDGFFVAVYNSGAGSITLDPATTEQIREGANSATTKVLAQGDAMVLFCDGSNWHAVAASRFWYSTSAGRVTTNNLLVVSNTTTSTSVSDGAITTTGGVGISGRLNVGGLVRFNDVTASTTTQSGSATFAGGVGVQGALLTKRYVVAQSTTSLADNRTWSNLTNEGAAGLVTLTLPAAATGLEFTIIVQDADGLRVTAASGDTIRISGTVTAAAGYVESTVIGDTVTLLAINATEWIATASHGTWTFGP